MVGGGDTATEEALYLTKYASAVHLLVRGPRLRASGAMQDRVRAHDKVTVHHSTQARAPPAPRQAGAAGAGRGPAAAPRGRGLQAGGRQPRVERVQAHVCPLKRLRWPSRAVRRSCRPPQAPILDCGVTAGKSARVAGAQVKDAFGDKKGMKGLVLTDTESGARPSPSRECRPTSSLHPGPAWRGSG